MVPIVSIIKYLCRIARECTKSYRSAQKLLKQYRTRDSLTNKTLNKALLYCFFIPSLAFEFARLTAHKPTKSEIELLLYLSIFSILHDTLLDETKDGAAWLENLINNSAVNTSTESQLQKVTREIYYKITDESLIKLLRQVTDAQLYSQDLSQSNQVTRSDVYKALLLKGIIYPIYIMPFSKALTDSETVCFSYLGGWLQSTDDISDKQQDMKNNILTLATFENGKYAREIEMALWSNFVSSMNEFQYDKDLKSNYLLRLRLMGNIYKRYAALENRVPIMKSLIVAFPLIFIWVPLCFVSTVEIFSERAKHI